MPLIKADKLLQYNIPGLKESLNDLDTGDILMFGGSSFSFSKLVRYWTQSQWSHVAMVLRDPTYIDPSLHGLYLWESGIEDFPDAEDHVRKFGVQINSLETLLDEGYDGYISFRKLHTSVHDIKGKIKLIHTAVHGKPYDTDFIDLLETSSKVNKVEKPVNEPYWYFWNWFKPNHRHNDKYFCSALLGFIYTELGLLPSTTKWTECTPKFFSSEENPTMKLTDGNGLGVDKLLYINPKYKQ